MSSDCPLAGEIFARWQSEDTRPLQHRLSEIRAVIEAYPAVPALKRIMAERTGLADWLNLRPPLTPLSEDEAAALLDTLRQLRFFTELSELM